MMKKNMTSVDIIAQQVLDELKPSFPEARQLPVIDGYRIFPHPDKPYSISVVQNGAIHVRGINAAITDKTTRENIIRQLMSTGYVKPAMDGFVVEMPTKHEEITVVLMKLSARERKPIESLRQEESDMRKRFQQGNQQLHARNKGTYLRFEDSAVLNYFRQRL